MRKMTNKEAIEALKWKVEYAKEIGESYIDCVYVEALDLAIKALENQTTEGDCISRRVVKGLISGKSIPIKFEEEKRGEWKYSSGVLLSDAYKAIDTAPPVSQVTVFTENADEQAVADMKAELQNVIESRPKGEWIDVGTTIEGIPIYSCSICHREIYTYSLVGFPFCHCGADMRGGAKE